VSRILVAEDEPLIASFVAKGLSASGLVPEVACDGASAVGLALTDDYDLLVLDIGLPGMDGFEVLRRIRAAGNGIPIIILTARGAASDTVSGLDGGADDYMAKPFAFGELLARIRLRLRPASREASATHLSSGSFSLDLRSRSVRPHGRMSDLSAREFFLLEVFLRHPGEVLSREQLLSHAWGYDFDSGSNVVDVYVRNLRRKVGPDAIETVRGLGYRLRA
jgi:two-component system copper resistance phosphate regulon response regulator CusR